MPKLDNKLIIRQLKKKFEGEITDEWKPLLEAVNDTYNFYDEDRKMLERSMDISSRELNEAYEMMRRENEANKAILDKLQNALKDSDATQKVNLAELNITELVDAMIEARDAAEHSAKIKDQFLGNMSHEIRTPMNGVLGMTNLLLRTELSSEQLGYINSIKFSADNLLVIINDILDFTKMESGKIELDPVDFSIEEVVKGVIGTIKFKADEKGLRIRRTVDSDIPPLVVGDSVRYNQVLLNLVGNAVKFTKKGRITVLVEIEEENDSHIIIRTEIADTGIGIPADKLERIFESFTQASSDTTRKYGGTGLGLAISKQLVELQEGTFEVESEIGSGSTFSFTLPFLKADLTAIKEKASKDEEVGSIPDGTRILLVEDNSINVRVAAQLLNKWNDTLIIDHADNGQIALDLFEKKDYDIILMDLHMPVKDGYETSRYIRDHFDSPKKDIPIVAVSASAFRNDKQKVTKAGMNGFVSKPFVPEALFEAIVKYL